MAKKVVKLKMNVDASGWLEGFGFGDAVVGNKLTLDSTGSHL